MYYKCILVKILTLFHDGLGVISNPEPFIVNQYDKSVALYLQGDEHFNYMHDINNYLVRVNENNEYAYVPGPQLASDVNSPPPLLGVVDPTLYNGLQKTTDITYTTRPELAMSISTPSRISVFSSPQTLKNLVVMVRFSDHTNRILPTVTDLEGVMTIVADVWKVNTLNKLTIVSVLTGWITVALTESQAAGGISGLGSGSRLDAALKDALTQVNTFINFKDFDLDNDNSIDCITFLHSGYGAEFGGNDIYNTPYTSRIWSHKYALIPSFLSKEGVVVSNYHISPSLWGISGSTTGRWGVIAHETGHFFGLPDLYDIDGNGKGLDSWSLMANSWGFDSSQRYPPHLDPWCKLKLQICTPITITSSGVYNIQPSATTCDIILINIQSNEYLLLEYRTPVLYDADIPSQARGLLIYHIDDLHNYDVQGYPGQSGWPQNNNHYRVALLQADGLFELEKNVWANANDLFVTNQVCNANSVPDTRAYQNGNIFDTGIDIKVLSISDQLLVVQITVPAATTTTTTSTTTTTTSTSTTSTTTTTTPTPTPTPLCVDPCTDNNPYTYNDKCVNGVCVGTYSTCNSTNSIIYKCITPKNRVKAIPCIVGKSCTRQTCCIPITITATVKSTLVNNKCTAVVSTNIASKVNARLTAKFGITNIVATSTKGTFTLVKTTRLLSQCRLCISKIEANGYTTFTKSICG